ncbi:MAG: DUF192 domain-containing protein [Candidatus Paceibacterota bacterium]
MKIIDSTHTYIYYVLSILLAIGVAVIGLLFLHFSFGAPFSHTVSMQLVNGDGKYASVLHAPTVDIPVAIANTDQSREQGLSGTTTLPPDSGMLFVFDTPGKYGFWMKDMSYGLDFVWLDANLTIIDITPDVAAISYPKIFYPSQPVVYVLEVNEKFSTAHGLTIGQKLNLSQK